MRTYDASAGVSLKRDTLRKTLRKFRTDPLVSNASDRFVALRRKHRVSRHKLCICNTYIIFANCDERICHRQVRDFSTGRRIRCSSGGRNALFYRGLAPFPRVSPSVVPTGITIRATPPNTLESIFCAELQARPNPPPAAPWTRPKSSAECAENPVEKSSDTS